VAPVRLPSSRGKVRSDWQCGQVSFKDFSLDEHDRKQERRTRDAIAAWRMARQQTEDQQVHVQDPSGNLLHGSHAVQVNRVICG
jgi:hypothetical protein